MRPLRFQSARAFLVKEELGERMMRSFCDGLITLQDLEEWMAGKSCYIFGPRKGFNLSNLYSRYPASSRSRMGGHAMRGKTEDGVLDIWAYLQLTRLPCKHLVVHLFQMLATHRRLAPDLFSSREESDS